VGEAPPQNDITVGSRRSIFDKAALQLRLLPGVMIRPRNEPSCICRSLCFSGSGDMTGPSQRLSRSCGLEMVARSLVRAPPVAHAPEKSGGNKAQAEEQREAAQNRGAIPKVSSMAVGTPAFVRGQHVMIRPRNAPSCICRSLCFTWSAVQLLT
jgi:hypothetical protein